MEINVAVYEEDKERVHREKRDFRGGDEHREEIILDLFIQYSQMK